MPSNVIDSPRDEKLVYQYGLGGCRVPRCMGVYVIRCVPSGKVYVGKSKHIPQRWSKHCAALREGSHVNVYLQRAWAKHGAAAFEFEVLAVTTDAGALGTLEVEYVSKLQATSPECGYNLNAVTADSYQASLETRQKQSEAQRAWHEAHPAQKRTPEQVERIRSAQIGRKASPETRAKMSAASKGRAKSPEHRAKLGAKPGRVVSDETRAKIGAGNRGKKMSVARTGQTCPPETRAKLSATHKQRMLDPKAREQLRQALLVRWPQQEQE